MPAKPTIVVVDTNCFIRLLFSPLRPVLGATFGGYLLMTLADLVGECGPGTEVAERHPWLLEPDVQAELQKNCLKLREPKKTDMANLARQFRSNGNSRLRKHCEAKKLKKIRELSRADVNALAAAQVLGGPLAAEGVLRYVWESKFGPMLIEVRNGYTYVNGQLVEQVDRDPRPGDRHER